MGRELLWACFACTIWGWLSVPFATHPPAHFRIEIRAQSAQASTSLSLWRRPDGRVLAEMEETFFLDQPRRLCGSLPSEVAEAIWTDLSSLKSVDADPSARAELTFPYYYDLRLFSEGKQVGHHSSDCAEAELKARTTQAIGRAERLVLEKLQGD